MSMPAMLSGVGSSAGRVWEVTKMVAIVRYMLGRLIGWWRDRAGLKEEEKEETSEG